ncbi:MAG: nucleotide-binding protein [Verrucomicrobia bacterium]|nr:nucleotide-binding protein [Verrucomicrobiota bacterium]
MSLPANTPPTSVAKPRLFIGCAREDLFIAKALQENLWRETEITVWDEDQFDSTHCPIEVLLQRADETDFAVLVFSPLDPSCHAGSKSARDNVVFETGLFLGKLGRNRVFLLKPQGGHQLKLPSDLAGLEPLPFDRERADGNWTSAVAPACTHIRKRIIALRGALKSPAHHAHDGPQVPSQAASKESTKQNCLESHGIVVDEFSVVGIPNRSTTAFFHEERFTKAFPGVREVKWFSEVPDIIERLNILLAPPLKFYDTDAQYGVCGWDPIWWWRGRGNNSIDSFRILSLRKCLLDSQELLPYRLAAVNTGSYRRSFVYLECAADKPTGLYPATATDIERKVQSFGYAYEEFAEFEGQLVTREEYDDGAAVIKGVVDQLEDRAALRVRYLTPYNLIIASKESPINNSQFDFTFADLMNRSIRDHKALAELFELIATLPLQPEFMQKFSASRKTS